MTTENLAKFKINGTASADPVTGDKGYQTTALATLTLTLEQVPSAALSVTYYVYSSSDDSSPLASKSAPVLVFTGSGTYKDTPASPNGTVELVMPATAAHSWNVRCVASTADGSDEYVRQVCIPYTLGVTDIFKTVPEETDEFYARGWSDKFNDYLAYIALFSIPTLDVSYDAGGAGLGRVVTVDSGAIEFNGSNAADYTLEVSNSGNGGVLYMNNTGTGRTFDFRIGGVASLVLDNANNLVATCASLSLEATGAVALFSTAGLLSFSDGFRAGSTFATDLVLSDAAAEWDLFEVNFGEVSILNAINQCAASAVTLDEAYNASAGPSTITVDAGDVTWNEVGAYSFVVGLSGCTGVADGFFVEDGTDHFRLTHAAANTLNLGAALADASIDAITISLDSSDDSNFSISANDAGIITLTLECTNVGAGTAEIDINADDAIMIDSTGAGISLDCATSANFTISANSAIAEMLVITATNAGAGTAHVDINADDAITVDSAAAGISLDGVTASNFTVTGGDLTLSTAVAGDLNLTSVAAIDMDGATLTADFTGTAYIIHEPVADEAIIMSMATGGGEALARYGILISSVASTVDATLQLGSRVMTGSGDVAVQIYAASDSGVANLEMAAQSVSSLGNIYLGREAAAPAAMSDNLYVAIVDAITIDAAGVIEINSSAGVISIGNDAVAQAINLGTAGARTITIGNATGATALDLKSGTGGINLHDGVAQLDLNGAGVLTETALVSADLTPSGTLTLRGGGVSQFGDDTGYINFDGTGALSTVGITTLYLDCSSAMTLNSSAGQISIGNNAVAQNINIGTAGARIVTVGNVTAGTGVVLNAAGGGIDLNCLTGAGTWDAATLSLDATDTTNLTMTANAAALKTLTISATNADALNYGDVDIDADGTVYIDAVRYGVKIGTVVGDVTLGAAGVTTVVVTGSSLSYTSLNDISLQANAAASPITVNDAVNTVLVGFTATSIVGAFNELKGVGITAASNTDVDIGTETVDTFVTPAGSGMNGAAFWTFFAVDKDDHTQRTSGYIAVDWYDGVTNVAVMRTNPAILEPVFTATAVDVGAGTNCTVTLSATVTSNNWSVKVMRLPYMVEVAA